MWLKCWIFSSTLPSIDSGLMGLNPLETLWSFLVFEPCQLARKYQKGRQALKKVGSVVGW